MLFWQLWQEGKINRFELKNKKVRFVLNIPYQELSGNGSLREVPRLNADRLDAGLDLPLEVNGPDTLQQPSVRRSPSVVPR